MQIEDNMVISRVDWKVEYRKLTQLDWDKQDNNDDDLDDTNEADDD